MKILIGLLGIWCFWNALRITDQLGHVMVFGGDQSVLWAGLVLFMSGTIGCIISVFGEKK
jgi:hypothetical protein